PNGVKLSMNWHRRNGLTGKTLTPVRVTNAVGSGNVCSSISTPLRRLHDDTPLSAGEHVYVGQNFVLTEKPGSCGSAAPVQVNDTAFGRRRDVPGTYRWH